MPRFTGPQPVAQGFSPARCSSTGLQQQDVAQGFSPAWGCKQGFLWLQSGRDLKVGAICAPIRQT
jgi:hypothetical protein